MPAVGRWLDIVSQWRALILNTDRYHIETNPSENDLQFLEDQINQYNVYTTSYEDYQPLAVFVRNDQDRMIAGLSGYTWGGCCEIKFLWVHPDYRQCGYGRQLLQTTETEARQRRCHLIVVDTYSFQAPQFYPKFGYTVMGIYEDCPAGHRKYYFQKRLEYPIEPQTASND